MRPVILVLFISALIQTACSGEAPSAAKAPPAATVQHPIAEADLTSITLTPEAEKRLAIQTTPVIVERVSGTRTVGGEVVIPPGRSVVVTAPVAGTLVAPAAGVPAAGTRVRRGQGLFKLLPLLPAERDLRIQAERDVTASTAEAEAARQRRERLEQLLKDGAASVRAVEEARTQEAVATASLDAARSRLAVVGAQPIERKGEISIDAPIDGVLRTVNAAVGQTVASAAPLFEVIGVDTVWVRVPIYAGDRSAIDEQQPAIVSTLGGAPTDPPLLARRVAAPPSADPNTAAVDLFFALANAAAVFRPGERVSVTLPLRAGESARVVPTSTIVYDAQGGTWLYEARPGHVYVRRRIEVSGYAGSKAVLARGPAEGASVVTTGAAELFGTEFGAGK